MARSVRCAKRLPSSAGRGTAAECFSRSLSRRPFRDRGAHGGKERLVVEGEPVTWTDAPDSPVVRYLENLVESFLNSVRTRKLYVTMPEAAGPRR
jgi:hypothetical protein